MGLDDTKDEHSEVSFNAFCDFMGIPDEDRAYALLVWTAGYLAAEHYYGLDEDEPPESPKLKLVR